VNAARVSAAQAEYDAAKLRADAALLAAEAERKISDMRGSVYKSSPEVFQLELAKIQASVFDKSTLNLTDQSLANMFVNPSAFFRGTGGPHDSHDEKK